MANANQGSQSIGWKYSTPLKADYLNTFVAGFSTPGLITRPAITSVPTSVGADVTVRPFSLLITPEDTKTSVSDAWGDDFCPKMVKITTTNDIQISIGEQDVALGFNYTFADKGTPLSQWYGELVALNPDSASRFQGIIVATCQRWYDPNATGNKASYSVTTNGADISDFLLIKEGWNPNKWLSVISPRRVTTGQYYNQLEVRTHNNEYGITRNAANVGKLNGTRISYINGNSGLRGYSRLRYNVAWNIDEINNPNGTRGFMQYNYSTFKLQSAGFSIAECSNALPIEKTSGGVFALVDASEVNAGTPSGSFTNRLVINPVEQESINIYYDNQTLFIK